MKPTNQTDPVTFSDFASPETQFGIRRALARLTKGGALKIEPPMTSAQIDTAIKRRNAAFIAEERNAKLAGKKQ